MLTKLPPTKYKRLAPLLKRVPPDPMLYMLLEGNRPGQVFVDRVRKPSVALIWTGMEYAYLLGDPADDWEDVMDLIEESFLPDLAEIGFDFLTIFPFGVSANLVMDWFSERRPVSFGVNAFRFDRDRFDQLRAQVKTQPAGFELVRLDRVILQQDDYIGIDEDIICCWDSLARFESLGLGYAIQDQAGQIVSTCYAIGVGAGAYHIDIWTHPDHRRKGLARRAANAFLDHSLENDRTIYWINDAPNTASRRLAESLGFVYTGDLETVDIPVFPGSFHLNLAEHFAETLELHREAGELYDTAFELQAGTSGEYRKAAEVWEKAGDLDKAEMYRRSAETEI